VIERVLPFPLFDDHKLIDLFIYLDEHIPTHFVPRDLHMRGDVRILILLPSFVHLRCVNDMWFLIFIFCLRLDVGTLRFGIESRPIPNQAMY
jgi:hypothetical protein